MIKKIQIFTLTYEPYSGGVETHISEVYKRLAKEGWDITVLSSTFKKNKYLFKANSYEYEGVRIIEYSPLLLKLYWLNIFWYLNLRDNEIIEFQNFLPLPGYFICSILWLLRKLNIKHNYLILSSHGWWEVKGETLTSRFFQYINESMGLHLLGFMVDRVKVVSESESLLISKYVEKEKITTVGNGVSDEAFIKLDDTSFSNPYGEYILHLSRLDRIKNIETSILSLKFLPSTITLLIAGGEFEKGYRAFLEKYVSENGLEDRVKFLGLIKGNEKYKILKNSIAHIHISKWESFGISAIEAMSQGTINIVGSNLPMAKLIEENNCGFIQEDIYDPKELARLILSIKEMNNKEILKMRESAVSVAKGFTWGSVAEQTEKFYVSL